MLGMTQAATVSSLSPFSNSRLRGCDVVPGRASWLRRSLGAESGIPRLFFSLQILCRSVPDTSLGQAWCSLLKPQRPVEPKKICNNIHSEYS